MDSKLVGGIELYVDKAELLKTVGARAGCELIFIRHRSK
jgi:hypothetical protein